jgi:hypothetical protein
MALACVLVLYAQVLVLTELTATVVATAAALNAVLAAGVAPKKAIGSLELFPKQVPSGPPSPRY